MSTCECGAAIPRRPGARGPLPKWCPRCDPYAGCRVSRIESQRRRDAKRARREPPTTEIVLDLITVPSQGERPRCWCGEFIVFDTDGRGRLVELPCPHPRQPMMKPWVLVETVGRPAAVRNELRRGRRRRIRN